MRRSLLGPMDLHETTPRSKREPAHVAILGAGLMGAQIGCEYALGGCRVSFVVRERARAERRVEQALALALEHELADEAALAQARTLLDYDESGGASLASDARSPGLIVEALPEGIGVKGDG